jgi:subtilisin family serine protease
MRALIIFIFCVSFCLVQAQEFVAGEVLIGIPHEYLSLPEGKSKAPIDEITATQSLINIFNEYEVQEIEKVYPDFQSDDTMVLTDNGKTVIIPDFSRIYKLNFPAEKSVENFVQELIQLYEVMYAEPNYIGHFEGVPNDQYFSQQWNMHQISNCDINAPEAWDIQVGSSSIRIGLFDTGIDYEHPDLGGQYGEDYKVGGGWNYLSNNEDFMDRTCHGTHVAGIAGALTNNLRYNQYYGVAGVTGGWGSGTNFGCQLFSFKIGDQEHYSIMGATRAILDAAIPRSQNGYGINVMNHSWGIYSASITVRSSITAAHSLNIVNVASKGNDNSENWHYPSDYGNGGRGRLILSVGATNRYDQRWVSYPLGSNYGNNIDVVAPGADVLSTMPLTQTGYMTEKGFVTVFDEMTGTSMAAPHVAGLAGLFLSQNTNLACEDVEKIIQRSAYDIDPNGYDEYHGYGRVDAYKALEYLRSPWILFHGIEYGGAVVEITDRYDMEFPNFGQIEHQIGWKVERYKINKSVNFSETLDEPWVWGRNQDTKGLSLGDTIPGYPRRQYKENWCDTVGGTLTSTGVIMQTNIYYVWRLMDDNSLIDWGWEPCHPQYAQFAYTIHGRRAFVGQSGFENSDPIPYENLIIYSNGVRNATANRCERDESVEPNVYPPERRWMYKITGEDFNSGTGNDYVAFKLYDCNIPIYDQTYLSFYIYVHQSPGDYGRFVIEGHTSSGKVLRDWRRYGNIIDQTGRLLHPAYRRTPPRNDNRNFYQFILNLSPAAGEVLTELIFIYHDSLPEESGQFIAYIDHIDIDRNYPAHSRLKWYPETFGNGPPGDPNFYLGIDTLDYEGYNCNVGAHIIVDGCGPDPLEPEPNDWLYPYPSLRRHRNPDYPVPISTTTNVKWLQYDKAHALHLAFLIKDVNGSENWLVYSKNAPNHWWKQGWVDMGTEGEYNIWQGFSRNLKFDYYSEYGVSPISLTDYRISHFCEMWSSGDCGGTVKGINIYESYLEPIVRNDRVTYPNTGELLVVDTKSGNLHMVYNANSKFNYVRSDDNGDTWGLIMQVDSATYPSITLDTFGLPRIIYLKNDSVFCQILKADSTWDTLVIYGNYQSGKPKESAVAPSYPPELANYSYSTFTTTDDPMGVNSKINFSIFDVTEDIAPPANEVASGDSLKSPSIAITPGDYVHIVWEQKGEIYYRTSLQPLNPEEEIVWSDIFNVSGSPMVFSEHPVVEAYGENIIVAWKEGNPGEIYRRIRNINSDIADWSEIENISQSSTQESDYPVLSTQDVVAWQEQIDSINYEIYAWIQGDIVNLSETENSSKYPHIAVEPQDFTGDTITPAIVINTIWTETVIPDSLYEVRFRRYEHTQGADGISGMIEYISVSVGDSLASSYCKKRDGFIQYGEYALDYSRSSLIYNLPYLKPQSSYLIRALVYQGERDRWREKMYIDDSLTADVYIDPKIPRMVNIVLPKASFGTDLEINKEIRRILGRIAIVADLKVYEVTLPDTMGDKEGALANKVDLIRYALYQNRPNPFKDITKISFALPRECNVSLFIYDITGRRVRTLINGKMQPGNYNYTWDGKDNRNRRLTQGVYFYRLQTKDFKDTKKTVLLK